MPTYDNPLVITYEALANSGVSSSAVMRNFIGPLGMKGRVLSCSTVVTTEVETAAPSIQVGITGGDTDVALNMSVALGAAGVGHQATKAELAAGAEIAADTVYSVLGGGEASAGAVDMVLAVGWYN